MYNIPPSKLLSRNENFIGRKEYLEQIESAFTKENKQVIILSSMSGNGKSSIANEIGHRLNERSLNQFVYWMKSDENYLEEEFRQFAFNLKIVTEEGKVITEEEKAKKPIEYIIKQIAFKLKSCHLNEQILFIFDNCDLIKDTEEYLNLINQDSPLINVKFLITTRIGSPSDEFDYKTERYIKECLLKIEIAPFKENETVDFLRNFLDDEVDNEEELNDFISLISKKLAIFRPEVLNKVAASAKLKNDSKHFKKWIEEIKNKGLDELENKLFENLSEKEPKAWEVKQCSLLNSNYYLYRFIRLRF